MAETIKVLEHTTPAIIIWSLMCAHASDSKTMLQTFPGLEAKGEATVVQAELIVNGVSLPVMDSLNEYWRRAESHLNQRARDFAFERIKGTRLQTLLDRLSRLETEINDELDKLFPGTERDWN